MAAVASEVCSGFSLAELSSGMKSSLQWLKHHEKPKYKLCCRKDAPHSYRLANSYTDLQAAMNLTELELGSDT